MIWRKAKIFRVKLFYHFLNIVRVYFHFGRERALPHAYVLDKKVLKFNFNSTSKE